MPWNLINTSTENDYIDFKQKWYEKTPKGKFDMVHDILAMANSLSDAESRFIFIGVEEHKETKRKTLFDISGDPNSRKTEEIITILRNYMSVPPRIEVLSERIEDKLISCIKIIPTARDLPYCLNSNLEYDEKTELPNGETKGKKHALIKNAIYSRDSSRNNGNKEYAAKEVVEELFARKRGENLPVLERFSLYLDDVKNWKKIRTGNTLTYYYVKNHKFKIVRVDNDDKPIKTKEVPNYAYLLDFGVCAEYWGYNQNGMSTYDDMFYWFESELWADNTPIETFIIASLYARYYFTDKFGLESPITGDFFLPNTSDIRRLLYEDKNLTAEKLKNIIATSLQFKICRMMHICDHTGFPTNLYNEYLNFLNWEYFINSNYFKENENFAYEANVWKKA